MNPGEELRSGASTSTHAFILGSFPFGETDKIVHLLTRDAGYVHGLARRAARSQKRFGASLETFSHVVAHLKVPRDFERNADKLWTLESCELRDPFLHLRKSYELMDSAFFVVQVLLEILPLRDPSLSPFVMLGRLLRDSEMLSNSPRSAWIRPFVLSWVGEAAGFGNINSARTAESTPSADSAVRAELGGGSGGFWKHLRATGTKFFWAFAPAGPRHLAPRGSGEGAKLEAAVPDLARSTSSGLENGKRPRTL